MTTTEDTTSSSSPSRDFSSKPPQRPRRKSRRRGGGDESRGSGTKTSQWDPSSNMPEIDESVPAVDISNLQLLSRNSLIELAEQQFKIETASGLPKQDLILGILEKQSEKLGTILSSGVLAVVDDGFGFLRGERLLPGPNDIYVSQGLVKRHGLRNGDSVAGQVRQPRGGDKYYGLMSVTDVNHMDPEKAALRPDFDALTAIFPDDMFHLESGAGEISQRMIDLFAPVGKGQRGLIVSPPKAGKSLLLKAIANGIMANYPECVLMVVLIGERPEEVTDMRRSVTGIGGEQRGLVYASTFDEPVEDHTRVAEAALEQARRLVEGGQDVVILMDSLTRLARAYNTAIPNSGRTLSGGMDPVALYPPKRFFGSARNTEEAASLTIIATCLVETGSRMDEVIFEEFKGTGNMELRLARKLAEKQVFPAIDVLASSTRRDDLLFSEEEKGQIWLLRRMAAMLEEDSHDAAERVIERLGKTENNVEFLGTLKTDLGQL